MPTEYNSTLAKAHRKAQNSLRMGDWIRPEDPTVLRGCGGRFKNYPATTFRPPKIMASSARQYIENPDRRSDSRYPVTTELEYRLAFHDQTVIMGVGQTVNMSSSGVIFQTSNVLPVKEKIELRVLWPARPDNTTPLKLHIIGRVVRAQGNRTAVAIERYEFRARRRCDEPQSP